MTPRRVAAALSLVLALFLAGVAFERIGAHAIVDAPNQHATALPPPVAGEQRIAVGPPAATLSVRVVDPKLPPRATIFVLHGIRDKKDNLRHFAEHLSEAGYRAVLVDARGHGASTGQWLTYGVQESRDLSRLVDALAVDGPVGVMGISYGGATAIEWAARDPRVRAAVAVAPFASLREIVPVYTPRTLPVVGWLVPRFLQMRTVDAAGAMAGFDPDQASPRRRARDAHADPHRPRSRRRHRPLRAVRAHRRRRRQRDAGGARRAGPRSHLGRPAAVAAGARLLRPRL